jgi:aminopeptidase N
LWSEHSGGPSADDLARYYHQKLRRAPQNLLLTDPGPRDMFDDRVYKRGALTLHALRQRLGDEKFFTLLQDWTTQHRHASVVTDEFTALADDYSDEPLTQLWDAWLYSRAVP